MVFSNFFFNAQKIRFFKGFLFLCMKLKSFITKILFKPEENLLFFSNLFLPHFLFLLLPCIKLDLILTHGAHQSVLKYDHLLLLAIHFLQSTVITLRWSQLGQFIFQFCVCLGESLQLCKQTLFFLNIAIEFSRDCFYLSLITEPKLFSPTFLLLDFLLIPEDK